jgi:hypothetical protein
MRGQNTYVNEYSFLQELTEQLSKLKGIHVEKAFDDNEIDVLVIDPIQGSASLSNAEAEESMASCPLLLFCPLSDWSGKTQHNRLSS